MKIPFKFQVFYYNSLASVLIMNQDSYFMNTDLLVKSPDSITIIYLLQTLNKDIIWLLFFVLNTTQRRLMFKLVAE